MVLDPTLVTFASLAAGWLLNELSHRLRATAAQRSVLGRALADLLEIRHHLVAIEASFVEVRRRWPVSQADLDTISVALKQILPGDKTLPERYNRAVDEIAGYDPTLAFVLRSKETIPAMLTHIRGLRLPEGENPEIPVEVEGFLRSAGVDALEGAIKTVAWQHGLLTYWRIRRVLRRKEQLPEKLKNWIEAVEKIANPRP